MPTEVHGFACTASSAYSAAYFACSLTPDHVSFSFSRAACIVSPRPGISCTLLGTFSNCVSMVCPFRKLFQERSNRRASQATRISRSTTSDAATAVATQSSIPSPGAPVGSSDEIQPEAPKNTTAGSDSQRGMAEYARNRWHWAPLWDIQAFTPAKRFPAFAFSPKRIRHAAPQGRFRPPQRRLDEGAHQRPPQGGNRAAADQRRGAR